MTEHPDDILRALADPDRLRIAGALAAGDAAAATLAGILELPLPRVRRHLTRLAAAGVARLQPDNRTYRLDRETLRWAAEQVGLPREAGIALGAANDDEETVLRAFFRDGRLTEIPTKASKRRIVLERIAIEFEPGVRYDEREVNAIVGAFFNDHAALRRYLVDEGFLDREAGVYWRAGGASTYRRARPSPIVSGQSRRAGPSHRRFRTFASEMMHLKPTGSAIAILVLIAGVLLGASPASATHPGPCNFHRLESESIQHFAKRKIACAVQEFGPVPGGPARAICIAKRESGLDASATSEPTGRYRGLFQHDRSFWAWRYDTYTKPAWELSHRVLNGRTNAIITIRMVFQIGTWRAAGWPPKEC